VRSPSWTVTYFVSHDRHPKADIVDQFSNLGANIRTLSPQECVTGCWKRKRLIIRFCYDADDFHDDRVVLVRDSQPRKHIKCFEVSTTLSQSLLYEKRLVLNYSGLPVKSCPLPSGKSTYLANPSLFEAVLGTGGERFEWRWCTTWRRQWSHAWWQVVRSMRKSRVFFWPISQQRAIDTICALVFITHKNIYQDLKFLRKHKRRERIAKTSNSFFLFLLARQRKGMIENRH